ncbi:hypothetical protein [Ciceribacter selenitireducens]
MANAATDRHPFSPPRHGKGPKTTTARVVKPALPETELKKTGSDTAKKISQAQNAGKSYQCPKSDVPAGFLDAVFHEDSV